MAKLLVGFEKPDWNEKSKIRNLLQPEEYRHIFD